MALSFQTKAIAVTAVVIVGAAVYFNRASSAPEFPPRPSPTLKGKKEFPKIKSFTSTATVHDGDTIDVLIDGKKWGVRIWGIDAPELKQTCTKDFKEVACGAMALNEMAAIINKRSVSCEFKARSYNRIVAKCFAGDTDIGRELIRRGYAFNYGQYSKDAYKADETYAKGAKLGLWTMTWLTPECWRDTNLKGSRRGRPSRCDL